MTTSDRTPGWYRFGLFEVDERRGEIRKRGIRIRLRGRPFDILLILLERPGDLISRDELRSRLWAADTFVDFDHGVNTAVNRLREVLGDAADNPRFIETVPRKGYRFIAPVDMLPLREPLTSPAAVIPPASVEPEIPAAPVPPAPPNAAQEPSSRRLARGWMGAAVAVAVVAIAAIAFWIRPAPASPAAGPLKMRLAVISAAIRSRIFSAMVLPRN
jgi:DNA-binding winged helix-turn-helix (wHTH) protein